MYCSLRGTRGERAQMRAMPPTLKSLPSFLYGYKCAASGMITFLAGAACLKPIMQLQGRRDNNKSHQQTDSSFLLVGVPRFLGGIYIFLPKPELAWVDILVAIHVYHNMMKLQLNIANIC